MNYFDILMQLLDTAIRWIPVEMEARGDLEAAADAVRAAQQENRRLTDEEWATINAITDQLVERPPQEGAP